MREAQATTSQIYRLLNYALGTNSNVSSSAIMSRISFARLICQLTDRDTDPDTNGLTLAYFSDAGSYAALINEVSNTHVYTVDSNGKETWRYNSSLN